MKTYIGIDLGTSGTKLLLVSADGQILAENTQNYEVAYPNPGWTEQNPSDWWNATKLGLCELLKGQDKAAVCGISFGGQMHGLVVLDKDDNVIRPCILWNDGRTEKQTEYLNTVIGKEKLSALTGNIAFAGFTAPKILWMKENEPENFAKIARIMLPKDYLAYMLSGKFVTDFSDASGMLLLDVKGRAWSKEMCDICGISKSQLPELHESFDAVGTLKAELAEEFGLSPDVKIIAGAGDNAAAAIGTGTVCDGSCNISLGTSGTIFISANEFSVDSKNALHSFCHANGSWHLMGCILSAASCRKWWLEDVLGSKDYAADEKNIENANTDGLYFLPYLLGERSPHNDTNIRGAFIGLSATTDAAQMSRAVIEGVTFAIRDCLEVAKQNGVCPSATTLCGGGSKSRAWRQLVADVFNMPVNIPVTEQGPGFGAAILAMVGCGEYESVEAAAQSIVKIKETIRPNRKSAARYKAKYKTFKKLYPALRKINLK
jgi:xylulokinase